MMTVCDAVLLLGSPGADPEWGERGGGGKENYFEKRVLTPEH